MKLKAILGSLLLGICLLVPASAELSIQDLKLRKGGSQINVRVVVGHPGAAVQKGPVALTLWVHPNPSAEWAQIKGWNDIAQIKPGDKVARDLFVQNSPELCAAAHGPIGSQSHRRSSRSSKCFQGRLATAGLWSTKETR